MTKIFTQNTDMDLPEVDSPYVTFRVTNDRDLRVGTWTEVALPLSELPAFYWEALGAGWSVDIGSLLGELKDLGEDLGGAVGEEREGSRFRVETTGSRVSLIAG